MLYRQSNVWESTCHQYSFQESVDPNVVCISLTILTPIESFRPSFFWASKQVVFNLTPKPDIPRILRVNKNRCILLVHMIFSDQLYVILGSFGSIPKTYQMGPLPETNSKFAPENRPKPNRKGSYSNHPFLGAKMLVSGRVALDRWGFFSHFKNAHDRTNVVEIG